MIAAGGHYELIAREAYPYAIPPAIAALLFWWSDLNLIAFVFFLVAAVILIFFRNPKRTPPPGEAYVLSPADGKVVEVTDTAVSENLNQGPVKKVSIFMSLFDTHVNRSPVSGEIVRMTDKSGSFLDARDNEASERNTRKSLILRGDLGTIEVVQVAGLVARKITSWVHEGTTVRRGERIGVVHFGSRLDVYLPQEFRFRIGVGSKVRAGSTIIAEKIEG